MSQLKVPTQSLEVTVTCADGRVFKGRVFLPANASRHTGPMRAEEWMNDSTSFFPFVSDSDKAPVMLNKREVLVLTVPAEADRTDLPEEAQYPRRTVTIECEAQRLKGELQIELPEDHNRVLDHLNGPQAFLTLHDGDRDHLIQKERITRVIEEREG